MTKESRDHLLDLIGQTYDAALDETKWAGLAPEIARTFDSTSTTLFVLNTRNGTAPPLSLTENLKQQQRLMADYSAYYWQRDLWFQGAVSLGMSRVHTSQELVADTALERSEFHSDYLKKLEIFYCVGSVFPIAGDEVGVYSSHRPRSLGNYEQEDARVVSSFLPHLRRALQIRQRLADPTIERSAALDALDRTSTATLVVTDNGRILYGNAHAEALLRSGDTIRVLGGRLATADRSSSQSLAALIGTAIDTASGRGSGSGGAVAIPRGDRLPLTILVVPFRPAREGLGSPVPAAILFIRDPERLNPSNAALQDLFGLTPAEACMASTLANGKSVAEFTAINRVSLNTARTHLKAVFAKTGTRRQAELVALILRSVSVMAPK